MIHAWTVLLTHAAMQGESLPLWGTVEQLIDGLTAAGIGQRPVVFVSHRSGPMLVSSSMRAPADMT